MTVGAYLALIRFNYRSLAAGALLGLIFASVFLLTQPKSYTATAEAFVSTSSSSSVADLIQGNTFTQGIVKSYAGVVSTPYVLQPVIDKLHLRSSAVQLARRVQASAPLDTAVISIVVSDRSPRQAADIANAVTAELGRAAETLTPASANATSSVRITQVQSASPDNESSSPSLLTALATGLAVGVGVALVVVLLRRTLDTSIRSVHDLQDMTEAPVLGSVRFDRGATTAPVLPEDAASGGHRGEEFRTLSANVQFLQADRRSASYVITSSIENEGKSTSACNLAIAAQRAGRRVVLVDGDLRRPRIADYMGIDGGTGLTDVLVGRLSLEMVLQPWGQNGLTVLPAGQVPPNPNELLQSAQMVQIIEVLTARFELVLFDAAPLLPVSDAAVLAKNTDGVVMICAAGRVRRPQLHAAFGVLSRLGVEARGIIATMLPPKGPESYGYGNGYYG